MLIRALFFLLLFSSQVYAATHIVAEFSDSGDGVDTTTFGCTIFDGTTTTNETANFTRSGNIWTLMAANRTATFNYDESISVNLTLEDLNNNVNNWEISYTVESAPVTPATDQFADGASGNRTNWTEKAWNGTDVIDTYVDPLDPLNVVYGTQGTFTGGNVSTVYQPGVIAMYPLTISGNSFVEVRYRIDGSVANNLDITFGTGANNIALNGKKSTFIKFLSTPNNSRYGYMDPTTGERMTVVSGIPSTPNPIPDNNWHVVRIEIGAAEGSPWVVKVDGALFYTGTVQGSPEGFFWFGSDNDKVMIDGPEGLTEGSNPPPIDPGVQTSKKRMTLSGPNSGRINISGVKTGRIEFRA